MKTEHLIPGTSEWHAHRATHFNASDAPAMLGCSPYKTRAQLLKEKHTGIRPEVDAGTQRRFDDGHRFEELARPLAEEIIGDDLAPVVGTLGELSASFDGLTLMGDTAWEHKSLNDDLRACMRDQGNGYDLPKHYQVQMEQQLLVSGAERVLFMATKWTPSGELVEERHCWYASDPALRAEIVAGWKQFAIDLASYRPAEAVQAAVAAPMESLPAVAVQVQGALSIVSNLDKFGLALRGFISKIPAKPTSDQEFADCEAACKALKKAEDALDAAETGALAQIASVEEMTRAVADLRKLARDTRLASEKVVKQRKDQIRTEEVARGRQALADHIAALNTRLGKPYMPAVPADFASVISGLKKLDSLRDAIDTEIARAKIAANEIADRIQANLQHLREHAAQHAFLFADTAQLVLKAPEDCAAVVSARIAEHRQAEEKRLEAERERIRAEEEAKLRREREAEERRQREEAERQAAAEERRQEAERAEQARQAAEAAKPAHPPAPEPVAAPAVIQLATVTRAPDARPNLRLGQINELLAPITLTADGLAALGFQPVAIEKAAKLYRAADVDRIPGALIAHLQRVQRQAEAA